MQETTFKTIEPGRVFFQSKASLWAIRYWKGKQEKRNKFRRLAEPKPNTPGMLGCQCGTPGSELWNVENITDPAAPFLVHFCDDHAVAVK